MTSRSVPEAARAGLYPTVWPSEHTDLWRTHTVLGAGLPAGLDPARLAVAHTELDLPVWGYTRDRDQVFVTGGSPVMLEMFTKMIIAGRQVPIGRDAVGTPSTGPLDLMRELVRLRPTVVHFSGHGASGESVLNAFRMARIVPGWQESQSEAPASLHCREGFNPAKLYLQAPPD